MERKIDIVLVRPEGEINIGLISRAMKNFGVETLKLVKPFTSHLSEKSKNFAANSYDILTKALIFDNLSSALENYDIVLGFSRRSGQYRKKDLNLQKVPQFLEKLNINKLALMFGNEQNGLSDEELYHAHITVYIPTHLGQPSLNLSHSVALALYELSQIKEIDTKAFTIKDISSASDLFMDILNMLNYFENEQRALLFKAYFQKIILRGVREKEDALVVKNLLTRLKGIIARKLERK